jgi:CheY-like chemotaxis protein/HPt (histidine-containing phosphotransfer) domain-containing protein
VESGSIELKPALINLRTICEDVAELLTPKADSQKVEIVLNYPTNIPENLIGDAGRIRQILVNLCGNAVKFTESGNIYIDITCDDLNDQQALIRVQITDTGTGIPADKLPNLFQKFYQVNDTSNRTSPGTGLGLAISRSLIELMGGEIGIRSTYGSGSTFWFKLPLAVEPVTSKAITQYDELADMQVLIIDDLRQSRLTLSNYLSSWGMRCSLAQSGKNAIKMMQKACNNGDPFKLVLIDQTMPCSDGIQVAQEIKNDPMFASTRLILLNNATSNTDYSDISPDLHFSAVIRKPVRLKNLRAAIETAAICLNGIPENRCEVVIDTPPLAAEKTVCRSGESFGNLRMLVAEDNIGSRIVAATMLQQLGCATDVASTGCEALEMALNTAYDMIFMDCNMPELNGFEATAEIRRHEGNKRHTVIVALTANAIKGHREKCLVAGMDDFLSKPIRSNDIQKVVTRWTSDTKQSKQPQPVENKPDIPHPATVSTIFEAFRLKELLQMFKNTGKDFFPTVVEPYLQSIEESMPKLRYAADCGNFSGICDTAHFLRGGSKNLGLQRITNFCSLLMNNAQINNKETVRRLVSSLEMELPLVKKHIYKMREKGLI